MVCYSSMVDHVTFRLFSFVISYRPSKTYPRRALNIILYINDSFSMLHVMDLLGINVCHKHFINSGVILLFSLKGTRIQSQFYF